MTVWIQAQETLGKGLRRRAERLDYSGCSGKRCAAAGVFNACVAKPRRSRFQGRLRARGAETRPLQLLFPTINISLVPYAFCPINKLNQANNNIPLLKNSFHLPVSKIPSREPHLSCFDVADWNT